MSRKKNYIIVHDIVDDRKRARVASVLKDYGLRVQKSVFQCYVNAEMLQEIKERVGKIINVKEDSVIIYPVCEACIVSSSF